MIYWSNTTKERWQSYQFSSVTQSCPTLCDPMDCRGQASLSITNYSWSLLKLMSIELMMSSNHLILCHPLLILHSIFPSIRVFSSESVLHTRWPSIGDSASILLMKIQGWFPLGLTGFLSLRSKELSRVFSRIQTSVLWHSAFLMIQPSHPYMTTGKIIALTIWTVISKLMSLLFHTLSRFVIAFLPRSKCLFISWLQSPSAVILEPRK